MDTVVRNGLLGAAAGVLYGALQVSLRRQRKFPFSTSHPFLHTDQQLAGVLHRYERIAQVDEASAALYQEALQQADDLIAIAHNHAERGGQFKAYRNAHAVRQRCAALCESAKNSRDDTYVRDAAALEVELAYIEKLCDNYVHNMIHA